MKSFFSSEDSFLMPKKTLNKTKTNFKQKYPIFYLSMSYLCAFFKINSY